jgi:hypothetical protein
MSKCKNYVTVEKVPKKIHLKSALVYSRYLHLQTSNLCVLIDLNNRCNYEITGLWKVVIHEVGILHCETRR